MTFQTLSPLALASQVWAAATRTLSSFGTGAIKALTGVPGAVPASTTVGITPPAGQFWFITINVGAGAAGSVEVGFSIGGSNHPILTVAAGNYGGITVMADPTNAPYVKNNDAANTAALTVSGCAFVQ